MLRVMAQFMQVVTAVGSEEEAGTLARGIAGARLAASVQIIGPIRSLYWWKGELVEAPEWQVQIRTTTERLGEIEEYIKANHSYETPGIAATEFRWGSPEYLAWISAQTRTDA